MIKNNLFGEIYMKAQEIKDTIYSKAKKYDEMKKQLQDGT